MCLKVSFEERFSLQSKLSRLPGYLTVQMVRFFYKEKEAVNAKVLKVWFLDFLGSRFSFRASNNLK